MGEEQEVEEKKEGGKIFKVGGYRRNREKIGNIVQYFATDEIKEFGITFKGDGNQEKRLWET